MNRNDFSLTITELTFQQKFHLKVDATEKRHKGYEYYTGGHMGTILKYKDGREATVQLESGEKILIEVVKTGIVIRRIHFYGLLAFTVVVSWKKEELATFFELFAKDQPNHLIFQEAVNSLKGFASTAAIKAYIAGENSEDAGTS